ncbi:MAG TPA: peptide chain release factor 3, partial [Acidimicrobiales bacterium]
PSIPSFAPEEFVVARPVDTGRFKQFRKGLAQLDEEGVVQVLRDPDLGDTAPVLAAVGRMQFEVFAFRLDSEFGAAVELSPTAYRVARRTDVASAPELSHTTGVRVLERADGTLLALFESPYWLDRLQAEKPDLTLERIVAD